MSFSDWLEKKEKEQQKANEKEKTANSKDALGGKTSFSEWLEQEELKSVDQKFIDTFFADANSFLGSVEEEYNGLGWGTASSAYDSRISAWDDLSIRSSAIRNWLDNNKSTMDADSYSKLSSTLDSIDESGASIVDAFKQSRDYFAQFSSEAEYNDATKLYELYSMSSDDLLPYLSGEDKIAYTTSTGHNVTWQQLYDEKRLEEETNTVKGQSDFEEYSKAGASVANPTWNAAQAPLSIGGWTPFGKGKEVSNMVTFAEENAGKGMIDSAHAFSGSGKSSEYTTLINLINEHMEDDEKAVYNYYIGIGDKAKADAYLESLDLQGRAENKVLTDLMLYAAKDPVGSSAISVVTSLASGGEFIVDTIKYASTGELDTNLMSQMTSTIRGTVSDKVDWEIGSWDAFDFLYNTGMSWADSMASMGVFKQGGGIALGLSAAASAVNDALDRGMSNWDAFTHGLHAGLFECLFETISLGQFSALKEAFASSGKEILKNIAKSMVVNLSEEAATEVANIMYDRIANGDFSQYETNYRAYIASGMTPEAAKSKVTWESVGQIVESAASGALMGIASGTLGSFKGRSKGAKEAKKAYGQTEADTRAFVQRALEINPDNALAKDILSQLDQGKKVSGLQLKLLEIQSDESLTSQDKSAIQDAAKKRLIELGATEDTEDIDTVAAALAKQASGEKLTLVEKNAISTSMYGKRVANELDPEKIASGEYTSEWAEKIGTRRVNFGAYNKEMVDRARAIASHAKELDKGREATAVSDAVARAEDEAGKEFAVSEDGKTIITAEGSQNGKEVTIKGVASTEGGKLMLALDDGSTVDASNVSFGSQEEALMYEMVARMEVTPDTANEFLKRFNPTNESQTLEYFANVPLAYTYGLMGYEAGLANIGMSEVDKRTAYNRGRADAIVRASSATKTARKKATQTKHGEIILDGVEYDESTATELQKANMVGIEMITKMSHLNVHAFSSFTDKDGNLKAYINGELRDAPNGYFQNGNDIYIDINAGDNLEGVMLHTMAHEVTHYIKKWNAKGFKAIGDFLIAEFGKQGVPVHALLESQKETKRKSYEKDGLPVPSEAKLTEEAFEELVADAMSTMLSDPKAYEKLAKLKKQNRTLWQQLGDAIKSLLDKLKKLIGAYKGRTPDSAEAQYVMDFAPDVYERLQDLYLKAFVEADENYAAAVASGEFDLDGEETSHTFSQRSMVEGAGLRFILGKDGVSYKVLDKKGKPVTEVTADMIVDSPLGNLVTMAKNNGFLGTGKEATLAARKQYEFLAELVNMCIKYSDIAPVWEIAGSMMFSSVKSNSDTQYGLTVDFSTVCKKTQEIVDVMSATMVKLGRGLTRDEVENIVYEEVVNAEEPVPCHTCYVFARWMGIGGILQQVKDFQDKYASMSEESLLEVVADFKNKLKEWAYIPDRKGQLYSKFFDKNGEVLEGQVIAHIKSKADSKIRAATNALAKNAEARLQIQELEVLMEHQDEKEARKTAKKIESKKRRLKDVSTLESQIQEAEDLKAECEEYQWLMRVLMVETEDGLRRRTDEEYEPVPPEILFDLNKGAEFASNPKWASAWAYRTTKGANAGKAILPYSDARVGEAIQSIAQGSPKGIDIGLELNPFLNGDTEKRRKILESAIEKQARQNLLGGQRYQSTSDFRYEYGSDYLITFLEMQAIGAKVQLYTKVIEAVDFLATVGADVNLSVMPLGDGFVVLEDGTKKLVYSSVSGINAEAAIEKSHEYNNVQLILVGISDEHIRLALAGDEVTFVIPFHGSGNRVATIKNLMGMIKENLDLTKAHDYEKVQSDHVSPNQTAEQKAMWNLRVRIVKGEATELSPKEMALLEKNAFLKDLYRRFYLDENAEEYGVGLTEKQAGQIFPYEYWDKSLTYAEADKNGDRFLEYCATMGIIPRFSGKDSSGKSVGYGDFTKDKGYWKLLIDRPMYDNEYDSEGNWIGYGKYHEQQRINCTNFQVKHIDPAYGSATYGDVMSKANDPKKVNAIRDAVIRRLETTYSERGSVAERDSAYLDAVSRGDMETAQRMVDEAAKKAGYDVTTYHGTDKEFTVFKTLYHNEFGYHTGTRKAAEDRVQYRLNAKVLKLYTNLGKTIRTPDVFGYFAGMHDYIFWVRGETDKISDMDFLKQYGRTKKFKNTFPSNDTLDRLHSAYVEFVESGYKGSKANAVVELTQEYLNGIGVDSIAYTNAYESAGSTSYLLMDSNRVKSADPVTYDDNGDIIPISKRFDTSNPDIRYSDRSYAPTFYSHMGKVIDGIKTDKVGAGGVVPYLKGKGVKDEEIKWSGIEAWLEGKKSVTKAELQEFVAGSQLRIEEESSSKRTPEDIISDFLDSDASDGYTINDRVFIEGTYDYFYSMDDLLEAYELEEGDKIGHLYSLTDEFGDTIISSTEDIESFADSLSSVFEEDLGNNTRWSQYKLDGGTNYRELVFKMPNSSYSNSSMRRHWGEDAEGVIAHARIQDMTTSDGKRMLFIEEIQSDWHNEGAKEGYDDRDAFEKYNSLKEKAHEAFLRLEDYSVAATGSAGEWETIEKTPKGAQLLREYRELSSKAKEAENAYFRAVPDAPFRTTYHEYVLKRLIRMAAEEGYDAIGWTPAWIQSERWSEDYEEGYRIEYDQDIPSFLKKYGKKWGATVSKANIRVAEHVVNGEHYDAEDIGVWSMSIPDSMKDSVLHEGQPMYSERYREGLSETDKAAADKVISTLKIRSGAGRYGITSYGAYTDERIDREIRDSSSDTVLDYAKSYITWVDPAEFVYATTPSESEREDLRKEAGDLDIEKLSSYEQPIYLKVDFETGEIEQHEGRHRMLALSKAGVDKVAVVIIALNDDRYHTKPVRIMQLKGQDFGYHGRGEGFFLHDMLPLSKRYAEVAKKLFSYDPQRGVRYSERNSDSVSTRSLLANALESVAANDIERKKLEQYKAKIALLEAAQRKLAEIRKEAQALRFTKGRTAEETARLRELDAEATRMANRISTYDKQLLSLESTAALKGVLEREKAMLRKRLAQKEKAAVKAQKEKAAATQRELLTRYQEARKKAVESRNKTATRHKIKDVVADLNKLLLNPTKEHHVPIGLQKVVALALDSINMDMMNAEERVAYYDALIAKAQSQEEIDSLLQKKAFFEYRGMNFKDRVDELSAAYAAFLKSDDPLVREAHNEAIEGLIERVASEVGDTSLKDMSLAQLEAVHDMYKAVLATVRNANKLFLEAKQKTITQASEDVKVEVDDVGGHRDRVLKVMKGIKQFGWNLMKPVAAMKAIGSKTFAKLFDRVRAAEDTWAVDVSEAKEFYDSVAEKYGYKKWDFKKRYTFKDKSGIEFSISLEQMLSLYAYSKRAQADEHLEVGGFIFDDAIEIVEKKHGIPLTYEVNDANPYRLGRGEIAAITGALTDGQRGFVDEMQTYLSDVMGAKGNEVSLAMYDIKLYTEKFYFPLKTSRYFREFDPEKSANPKIKNAGFSKKTVPNAGNPIVLSNFMDVWASHVNDMSMYHAFALPLEDFTRVYNYSSTAGGYDSVQQYIKNAYGAQANMYIERLLTDLNGGARVDPTAGILNKFLGLFKKAKVFASLSVVIQQPSAMARAMAYINPKYFATAVPSSVADNLTKHRAAWAEVKKYAPVAIIKEMGYFDTGIGRSSVDWIKGNTTVMSKLDDIFSFPAAIADELTWVYIWDAVKKEVAATSDLDVGSEEFFKKAGERFTEVIVNTQVYDSVLSRSAVMRSKDTLMKMATAFMAEPITTLNMMVDGITQGKRGNKKFAASTIGAVAAQVVLNSALVSLVYALRDDDEDETYIEKYLASFTAELADGVLPFGYVPILKDIWSLMQGFDIERSDMALWADAVDALKQVANAYYKDTDDMDEDELAEHQKAILEAWLSVGDTIGSLTGLPIMNIRRDIKAVINTIRTAARGDKTTAGSLWDAIGGALKDTLPVVGWKPDKSTSDKLYDAIVSGDTVYADRLKATFEDEDKAENAIRKGLRENDPRIKEAAQAKYDGDIAEYTRIAKEIIAEGNFSQDNVVAAINAEINALKEDEGGNASSDDKATSIYGSGDYFTAIVNGDTATANKVKEDLINTAIANGKSREDAESSVYSSFRTACRDAYADGSLSRDKAMNMLMSHGGMEANDAYWEMKRFDYYAENGTTEGYSKYTSFHEAVRTGSNLKTVIKEYTDHGVSTQTLASQITSYYKPLYIEMTKTERAGIKGYLLNAYVLLGYNRLDKSKDIDKWLED